MPQDRRFISRDEAKPPFFVGIDLGGTTVKVGMVDDLGRPLCWRNVATEVPRGPEDASQRMGEAVRKAIDDVGLEPAEVARVGLGSPGTLDFHAGVMITPTNFPGWGGFPLRDTVGRHCGLPVSLANDASAAAYGEFWVGSGRGYQSLVMLTLGTGVGCGIIIGDLIIEGENGHGTECGHIIVDCAPDARVCSCKQTGHLEAYASANGVIARARDAVATGRTTSLSRRLAEGAELTPLLVAEEAEAGDKLAMDIVLETGHYLALGIVTLMHTIDPTGVLLGGAMTFGMKESDLGRLFLNHVRDEVKRRTFPMLAERTLIDFSRLGADAGVIAAAAIARVDHFKALRARGATSQSALTQTRATRAVG
jgi:glucokinase